MSKQKTKLEVTWVCDICGFCREVDNHGLPEGWREIVIALRHDSYKNSVDWQNYWEGSVCSTCFGDRKTIRNIRCEETAKPLLKRIWARIMSSGISKWP